MPIRTLPLYAGETPDKDSYEETGSVKVKDGKGHGLLGWIFGKGKAKVKGETLVPKPEQAGKNKPRKEGWLNKTFGIETGLISVTSPPVEAAGVLSLDDCIKIAITNHLPLQTAEKSLRLARMRIAEARRNLLPSATVGWEETYGRVYGRRYYGRKQYVEGQQPIFHGGELFNTLKQSEKNYEITKNEYDRIKNELILQVKKGYYSLEKARENLALQRDLVQEVEKRFAIVTKAYEAGVIPKLEHLNVTSQTSQTRYQIASAECDVSIAELILKQAMTLEMRESIEIKPSPEFKKVKIDFETALRAAFTNRPEMKIKSAMIEYQVYGIKIAKAKGWPKIDLLGNWGLAKEEYLSEDAGQTPASGTDTNVDRKLEQQWYAGVKASMPFWGSTAEYQWMREQWVPVISAYQGTQSQTNSAKLKIFNKLDYYSDRQLAEIDYDTARQDFIKEKQDVTMEVKEACFGYEKALLQLDSSLNKIKFQESDTEVTKIKRSMDEVPDSTVIESMIKLAQEKFGYLQAIADCRISLATLNKTVGVEDYFQEKEKAS